MTTCECGRNDLDKDAGEKFCTVRVRTCEGRVAQEFHSPSKCEVKRCQCDPDTGVEEQEARQ